MKPTFALAALLLLQSHDVRTPPTGATPQHLRYLRNLTLPTDTSGSACAVLDATTFAHTASRSADDLRLFTSTQLELPFVLNESEAQPSDDATALILNPHLDHGHLLFDLAMPPRPYTTVDLQIAAKDFLATATVTASEGSQTNALGIFTLFDLTAQHLARSTSLPLQESTLPHLHIDLHLTTPDGRPFPDLSPAILQSAIVPPSREAQTLFTTIASTSALTQQGHRTVATFAIPAHVPIERVLVQLDPHFTANFLRPITLTAHPDAAADSAAEEIVTGEISSTHIASTTTRNLHLDATLAADLRSTATITVAVDNTNAAPLPIQSIQLQMRRRTLCFHTLPHTTYALFYGDDALPPPVYTEVTLSSPTTALLGPEQRNPAFTPRTDQRPYTQRHPELLWILLLAAVTLLAATARHATHHHGRKR